MYSQAGKFSGLHYKIRKIQKNLIKIVGIGRGREGNMLVASGYGLGYTEDLVNYVIEKNKDSDIVKKQSDVDYNVLTGSKFAGDDAESEKNNMLSYLGADIIHA